MKTRAFLHFEDGKIFQGLVHRKATLKQPIAGETTFVTAMTGYQETATDPSFLGQHILYTSAHIGNYPPSDKASQSHAIHATSLMAKTFSPNNSFLNNLKIPIFHSFDSRALVHYLRTTKTSHISLLSLDKRSPTKEEFFEAFNEVKKNCQNLRIVSQDKIIIHREGDSPLLVIDYGAKISIINALLKFNIPLVSVPFDTTFENIQKLNPRMILLSNGPGDPRHYSFQINTIKKIFTLKVPLRGICLGHQLLGLALGGKIIKLPVGQRGINHPVLDHLTGKILITSQNHGYSLSHDSLIKLSNSPLVDKKFFLSYSSLFDQSVEGFSSNDGMIRSVQFHPEGSPGPLDAFSFFDEMMNSSLKSLNTSPQINSQKSLPVIDLIKHPPKYKDKILYSKILLIGSGPIKIGQASEFDYSGTQAIKALKEVGIDVVLLNSNPATIMTDVEMAFKTYIEPITKDTIKKIILKDNVDAIISTMGGQTSLNICIELAEENFLKDHRVALLGADILTIKRTEDRDLFAHEVKSLGYQTSLRFKAFTAIEAKILARSKVGFPLIIRRDFTLGGKGSALVSNEEALDKVFNTDMHFPVTLEKSLVGHKEIELEVMIDHDENAVIVCSIENIDPCGVHTGDSITVAPAQTISDHCFQTLRTMALTLAKHMGIVAGGANVQFAINPLDEDDIIIIEMNPRVSRSSALASKATGYPIAKISALLSVGLTLTEILNDITKAAPVAFEPTLDYVAVKIPLFPFDKFPDSSKKLGPQMCSIGEVLALGGTFNEAYLKALRSLELGLEILSLSQLKGSPFDLSAEYLINRLKNKEELSLLCVLDSLRKGISEEKIYELSQITPWFISEMKVIVDHEVILQNVHASEKSLDYDLLHDLKKIGFSDKYIALLLDKNIQNIFERRMSFDLLPVFKAVDTCAGEFESKTPYFYSTYTGIHNEALPLKGKGSSMAILGSGPNRIGQGIEFDYSCVKSCQHLQTKNISTIMINSNPETVSTDYDNSDRLYLAPLFSEDLFDIFLNEKPDAVISCFSGQTGINLRKYIEIPFRMHFQKIHFLGHDITTFALTEDRKLFSRLIKDLDFKQTQAQEVRGYRELVNAILEIGFPVILRPSYVIGGESMYILNSHQELSELSDNLKEQLNTENITFQVETYLTDALEYDIDLIRDKHGNTIFTICEHIEFAGVHSGDSGMITPPVNLTSKLYHKMKTLSQELADKLKIQGPINFQFAVKDQEIYCIEANPRGSRTFPFLSKAYHLSLPSLATDALLGESIRSCDKENLPYFSVKQSTFPFDRFLSDDSLLGPRMRSTGETMGIDYDKDNAILKSYLGNYPHITRKGHILFSLRDHSKDILIPYLKQLLKLNYQFLATIGTYHFIRKQGFSCTLVNKIQKSQGLSLLNVLKSGTVVMVFNTPQSERHSKTDGELIRNTAISYGIPCFTRKENIKAVMESLIGNAGCPLSPLSLQETMQAKGKLL